MARKVDNPVVDCEHVRVLTHDDAEIAKQHCQEPLGPLVSIHVGVTVLPWSPLNPCADA